MSTETGTDASTVIPISGKVNIKVKLKKLSGLEALCSSAYYAYWTGQAS